MTGEADVEGGLGDAVAENEGIGDELVEGPPGGRGSALLGSVEVEAAKDEVEDIGDWLI